MPRNLHTELLDGVITVDAPESKVMALRSASEEGMLVGLSSGATLAAIAQTLPDLPKGSRLLGFNSDTAERYLSVPDFLPEICPTSCVRTSSEGRRLGKECVSQ